jgi:hypothetical protein
MLAMGSSKPWPDALEMMTGQRRMDASAILEYFAPLHDWLIKANEQLGVRIGWQQSDSEKAAPIISSITFILPLYFRNRLLNLMCPKSERNFPKFECDKAAASCEHNGTINIAFKIK